MLLKYGRSSAKRWVCPSEPPTPCSFSQPWPHKQDVQQQVTVAITSVRPLFTGDICIITGLCFLQSESLYECATSLRLCKGHSCSGEDDVKGLARGTGSVMVKHTGTNRSVCVCLCSSDLGSCHENNLSGDCWCLRFFCCSQTQEQENYHLCPTSSSSAPAHVTL